MSRIIVSRTINAPIPRVFNTVADIREFARALPHIVNVEFLTDSRLGIGTRFRETRLMHGKEATTELEVTEYVGNDRVRLVADTHGTIWDTVFTVAPSNGESSGGAELTMTMDARPYRLLARLMNMLIQGMIRKAVETDLDLVKEYCERGQE